MPVDVVPVPVSALVVREVIVSAGDGAGICRFIPGRSLAGSTVGLAFFIALTVVLLAAAIFPNVSPRTTVYSRVAPAPGSCGVRLPVTPRLLDRHVSRAVFVVVVDGARLSGIVGGALETTA